MRFIGRTLAEDAIVRRHGEPDHNGNHCYLRGDAQNDILFDPLVGMNSGARGSSLIFDHPPAIAPDAGRMVWERLAGGLV